MSKAQQLYKSITQFTNSNKNYIGFKVLSNDVIKYHYSITNVVSNTSDIYSETRLNNQIIDSNILPKKRVKYRSLYTDDYVSYKKEVLTYYSNHNNYKSTKLDEKLENISNYDRLNDLEIFNADFNFKSLNLDYNKEYKYNKYYKHYTQTQQNVYRQSLGSTKPSSIDQCIYIKKFDSGKLQVIHYEDLLLKELKNHEKYKDVSHLTPVNTYILDNNTIVTQVNLSDAFLMGEKYCFNRKSVIVKITFDDELLEDKDKEKDYEKDKDDKKEEAVKNEGSAKNETETETEDKTLKVDNSKDEKEVKKQDQPEKDLIKVEILSDLNKISIAPLLDSNRSSSRIYYLESDHFHGHCKSFELVEQNLENKNKTLVNDYVYPYQFCDSKNEIRTFARDSENKIKNCIYFLRHRSFYNDLVYIDLDNKTNAVLSLDRIIVNIQAYYDHIYVLSRTLNKDYNLDKYYYNQEMNKFELLNTISVKEKSTDYKISIENLKNINNETDYGQYALVQPNKEDKDKDSKIKGLVAIIHGGPNVGNSVDYSLLSEFLLLNNYAIIKLNYTGSLGYGKNKSEYLSGHIGVKDVNECHDMIEQAVKENNYEDLKVHILGGSHGGFMSAWLAGKYPERYASACILFPAADFLYMYTATDIPDWIVGQTLAQEYSSKMHSEDMILRMYRQSPMSVVDDIKCPSLIMAGMVDVRTPWHQARRIYSNLKDRGVDCEFLLYEKEGHGCVAVDNAVDENINILMWIDKYNGEGED